MWGKNKYKQSTIFRRLKPKWEVLLSVCVVIACIIGAIILVLTNRDLEKSIVKAIGSVNEVQKVIINLVIIFDSICMILGFIIPFMSMFALVEASIFNVLNTSLSLIMWILMVMLNPMQTPYLVSAVFNAYCVVWAAIKWIRLYKEQQAEKNKTIDNQNCENEILTA
jgi:uncharacterized protein YacL